MFLYGITCPTQPYLQPGSQGGSLGLTWVQSIAKGKAVIYISQAKSCLTSTGTNNPVA